MNMFNDTVTIYNKYRDGSAEKWQRTVIVGVYWNAIKGAVMRKTGVSSADSVVIIIPKNIATERKYKKPVAFAELSDKSQNWTLSSGDYIVKGTIYCEIEKSAKELNAFDDVCRISSVDFKDFGGNMAHFEVSAK